jgi:hypothetical protein
MASARGGAKDAASSVTQIMGPAVRIEVRESVILIMHLVIGGHGVKRPDVPRTGCKFRAEGAPGPGSDTGENNLAGDPPVVSATYEVPACFLSTPAFKPAAATNAWTNPAPAPSAQELQVMVSKPQIFHERDQRMCLRP